ncbi:alpha/beta-hydrolase [Corynespora cassiicola Philippines]|uniref:Alpha/beta-hydrolase n=1 Tax=Corynespora cassiicola Philippines TaxID=1448308 RepID=A0A2T2P2N6_CORCC|nr:alpha/beta-hydrolase [Corynespora cassiicola Philippines]
MLLKSWIVLQIHAVLVLSVSQNETIKQTLIWNNCTEEVSGALPADCAQLTVPLDYTDLESGGTLNLSLIKINATKSPSKGSILINPGGPGVSGVTDLKKSSALIFRSLINEDYNIIGSDPRGTGQTLPFTCFNDQIEQLRFETSTPAALDESDTALGKAWANWALYAKKCQQTSADVGELIGTAFTARDVMQIVDALDEDGMLRFFGQSYGTFLGTTLAAMFPDRIDKLVLDGVVNPHEYSTGWEFDPAPIQDIALQQVFRQCIEAGSPACVLAGEGATVESLTATYRNLIQQLKAEPIVLGSNSTLDVVYYSDIMLATEDGIRQALSYATPFVGYLHSILERNATAYQIYRAQLAALTQPGFSQKSTAIDSLYGIRCSDSKFRAEELEDIAPQLDKINNATELFGGYYASGYIPCSKWQFKAKEIYSGDYTAKTKNPALLIGSPWDNRTPLVSAHNVSTGLEGSVVLQHNGLGHVVIYSPGQCAIQAIQKYFEDGTLPYPGTICEQDFGVFEGKSILDSFGLGGLVAEGQ